MGKTKTLEINGSSNIGLFGYATDEYCLVGKNLKESEVKTFEISLDVPVHEIAIGNSSQVGVYLNGNSKCLLIPNILEDSEKKALDNLKINYALIDTTETALGNNLIVSDNYFFHHPDMEYSAVDQIKKALGIKGEALILEDWEVIGSIAYVTSKGGLIQDEVPQNVIDDLSKKMKIEFELGTLNFGSKIISGCLVANCNGMVIGKSSAGIEITNADMALGFLEK